MTLLEIEEYLRSSNSQLIRSSVSKPWKNQKIVPGKVKGIWYDTILADPKTFNQLIAERDGSSAAILDNVLDCLVDYDMENKKWFSRLADFEIETDEKNDTLTVHYTIKEGIVWSYYNSDKKIPVTSDDFVFWYNEIAGDSRFNSSGIVGILFAVFMKSKDEQVKDASLPAAVSAIFGVTEPAMYGIIVPRKVLLGISCIAGAASGFVIGLFDLKIYTYAGMGLIGLLSFLNPAAPKILPIIIAVIVPLAVGFILTFMFYKDEDVKEEPKAENKQLNKVAVVKMPVSGEVKNISESSDAAFSSEALGKGVEKPHILSQVNFHPKSEAQQSRLWLPSLHIRSHRYPPMFPQ